MDLRKKQGHPFGNPMEPVSFAVIVKDLKILVGKRNGTRGKGQYGLPGGFITNTETTLDGCMREVLEETSVDLKTLVQNGDALCLAQAVEENTDDIGTRTIGINYLFTVKPEADFTVTVDGEETTDFKWVPIRDLVEDKELLFFNHNRIVRRLLSKVGGSK
jgi:bifunctional NMN adenylyltransferase/nudix hydrolase